MKEGIKKALDGLTEDGLEKIEEVLEKSDKYLIAFMDKTSKFFGQTVVENKELKHNKEEEPKE